MVRTRAVVREGHYQSIKAWLDQVRLVAGLPYPDWALMPSLVTLAKAHVNGDVFSFMWFDSALERPAALWIDPVNDAAYQGFLAGHPDIFDEYPVQIMLNSRGRAIRALENTPEYATGPMYRSVLEPLGVHWGMGVPVTFGGGNVGFVSVCRHRDRGPYGDADWALWEKFAACLGELGGARYRWSVLPAAAFRETDSATLWLGRDGRILTHGSSLRRILFLLQSKELGPPLWARCDRKALPEELLNAVEQLSQPDAAGRVELDLERDSGRFHAVIEQMQSTPDFPLAPLGISIRHQEPIDLAVARLLWTWPMSPQEKRILVATARQASLNQTAEVLGISPGTLKGYINTLLARFALESRDDLLEEVLMPEQERGRRSSVAAFGSQGIRG
jgi:DNA-binding CsgD family transcriptional regulator